jgi:hypothetical protein
MSHPGTRTWRPRARDWSLLALGVAAWVAIGLGGTWLYREITRPPASCGTPLEARGESPAKPAAGPRNALHLLTGTGRCS